jgi:hypothetical protein
VPRCWQQLRHLQALRLRCLLLLLQWCLQDLCMASHGQMMRRQSRVVRQVQKLHQQQLALLQILVVLLQ